MSEEDGRCVWETGFGKDNIDGYGDCEFPLCFNERLLCMMNALSVFFFFVLIFPFSVVGFFYFVLRGNVEILAIWRLEIEF
jgi:hypothetical protein